MKNFPQDFEIRLEKALSKPLFDQVRLLFDRAAPLSVRMNNLKPADWKKTPAWQECHWYPKAFVAQEEGLKSSPEFQAAVASGEIYPQSLSSMLAVVILDPQPEETILDLCAAPGSKTSQIASHMDNTGKLIALEAVRERFYKLKSVLELLGVTNTQIKWMDARRYHPKDIMFDRILVDAPCSSEGRFKTFEPKTFAYWSERKIKEMAHKQKGLLLNACRLLKPGGLLVYSTCTFAPEENEAVIDWLLKKMPQMVVEPVQVDAVENYPAVLEWEGKAYNPAVKNCFRVLPTELMEGFFITKLKREIH